jgi:hypothetical protein
VHPVGVFVCNIHVFVQAIHCNRKKCNCQFAGKR